MNRYLRKYANLLNWVKNIYLYKYLRLLWGTHISTGRKATHYLIRQFNISGFMVQVIGEFECVYLGDLEKVKN